MHSWGGWKLSEQGPFILERVLDGPPDQRWPQSSKTIHNTSSIEGHWLMRPGKWNAWPPSGRFSGSPTTNHPTYEPPVLYSKCIKPQPQIDRYFVYDSTYSGPFSAGVVSALISAWVVFYAEVAQGRLLQLPVVSLRLILVHPFYCD